MRFDEFLFVDQDKLEVKKNFPSKIGFTRLETDLRLLHIINYQHVNFHTTVIVSLKLTHPSLLESMKLTISSRLQGIWILGWANVLVELLKFLSWEAAIIVFMVLSSKFGFWVKMPKIDRPDSQDFPHLDNYPLKWGCLSIRSLLYSFYIHMYIEIQLKMRVQIKNINYHSQLINVVQLFYSWPKIFRRHNLQFSWCCFLDFMWFSSFKSKLGWYLISRDISVVSMQ